MGGVTRRAKSELCLAMAEVMAQLMEEGNCANVAYEKMVCYVKQNGSFLREDVKANEPICSSREYINGYKERISKL